MYALCLNMLHHCGLLGTLVTSSVQRHWTKRVESLEDLAYSERLRRLNTYSIRERLVRADLILVWSIMHGHRSHLEPLFTLSHNPTRSNSYKLFLPRFSTDIRSRFFSNRIIHLWNSLPDNVVSSPTLSTFKCRLHNTINDMLFDY